MSTNLNRRYQKVLAPVFILLMIVFVWKKTGIFFELNDDKFITEILSGVQTGTPNAHVGYVSYPLTLPISLLYHVTNKVPWYGLFLIFAQALAYVGVLESLYSRCRNLAETALGTLIAAALTLAGLYSLGCIQYTSTAAILAAAGYFCLLVQPEGRGRWIWFICLEILSCCLRTKAMMMMQPMGILTVWGMMLAHEDSFSFRRYVTKAGHVLAVPAAVFLIVILGDRIGNNEAGWAEYRRFNTDREILFDYGDGVPDYEEVKEILDRHQVTEADYEAFRDYIMLDWVVSPTCVKELAAYMKEHRVKIDIIGLLKSFRQNAWEKSYWGLRDVLTVLWIAVILGILLFRQFKFFWGAFGLLLGKFFCWGYLLYRGRFPLRVSIPLLVGEELFLLALLLCIGGFERKSLLKNAGGAGRIGKYLGVMLLCCFFIVCFSSGIRQYRHIREVNNTQRALMEEAREIEAYCTASPEKRYILDMWSVRNFSGSALETQIYQDRNNVISGSWYSNSPSVRRYYAQYFSGAEEFFFIVCDDGREEAHPGLRWLTQETGFTPTLYDSFTTSYGSVLLVWRYDLTAEQGDTVTSSNKANASDGNSVMSFGEL